MLRATVIGLALGVSITAGLAPGAAGAASGVAGPDGLLTGASSTDDGVPMPEPGRTEVAGVHWKRYGLVVVAGGLTPDGPSTTDLALLDLRSEEWRLGPELPGPRDHAALAIVRGRLYLIGGFEHHLSGPTAGVYRLDAPDGRWVHDGDLLQPRGALAVAVVQRRIVVIGGADGRTTFATTEIYDPRTHRSEAGPNLSLPREHLGAAAIGDTVYAVGGRPPNQASVEALVLTRGAPDPDGWHAAPSLTFSRGGNGATRVAGVVCTAGGEEAAGTIAPIECLRDGRWEHVADLRVPRHGLAVVGVGRVLHVIAGGPQPGLTVSAVHETLTLAPSR